MIKKFSLLSLLIASTAFAESGGAHDPHAIPWMVIVAQAFNLAVLFGALIYFLRAGAKKYFSSRQEIYLELVNRADAARREAEKARSDIAAKLNELESGSKKTLEHAQAEAAQMRTRIVSEAQSLAVKMKEEAHRSVKIELEKAKNELRQELLGAAVESARASLKEKVGGPEQAKLQKEFVDKIQVVR